MNWLSNLFGGGNNPSDAAMPYLNQIPGQTNQYMKPYFEAGARAINPLQEQYSKLLSNPGELMNRVGESFHESPGFKFALENALRGSDRAAIAGGMGGTPSHQFQNMQLATGLANQDYNNWLQNSLGLYRSGLAGEQGLAGMGQQAGQGLADMIAQTLASQAGYGYAGEAARNQQQSGLLGNIGKAIGALSAFTPFSKIGNVFGSALGG